MSDTGMAQIENPVEAANVVIIEPANGFMSASGSFSLPEGRDSMKSGNKVKENNIEIKSKGLFPEPLIPDSTACLISSEDIVPGLQEVTKPAGSTTITASVGPLGRPSPVLESASSRSNGQDSLITSAWPSMFTALRSLPVAI